MLLSRHGEDTKLINYDFQFLNKNKSALNRKVKMRYGGPGRLRTFKRFLAKIFNKKFWRP
jgi:hypothetical protein